MLYMFFLIPSCLWFPTSTTISCLGQRLWQSAARDYGYEGLRAIDRAFSLLEQNWACSGIRANCTEANCVGPGKIFPSTATHLFFVGFLISFVLSANLAHYNCLELKFTFFFSPHGVIVSAPDQVPTHVQDVSNHGLLYKRCVPGLRQCHTFLWRHWNAMCRCGNSKRRRRSEGATLFCVGSFSIWWPHTLLACTPNLQPVSCDLLMSWRASASFPKSLMEDTVFQGLSSEIFPDILKSDRTCVCGGMRTSDIQHP